MVKKLLITLFCLCGAAGARADMQDEIIPLLQRIDLVLFLLEGNTLRMERYGLHEVAAETTIIGPEVSAERTMLKICLTDGPSCAGIVSWDCSCVGQLKIIAGQKRSPQTYFLPLTKIVNQTASVDNCVMLCFDCFLEYEQESNDLGVQRKSIVEIVVPIGDAQESMKFVFDGVIDAACGMFVQNDLFQGEVPVCGELNKDLALASGVLVERHGAERGSSFSVQRDVVSKPSFFDSAKATLLSSLSAIKNFCSTTWQKLWGVVRRRSAE